MKKGPDMLYVAYGIILHGKNTKKTSFGNLVFQPTQFNNGNLQNYCSDTMTIHNDQISHLQGLQPKQK